MELLIMYRLGDANIPAHKTVSSVAGARRIPHASAANRNREISTTFVPTSFLCTIHMINQLCHNTATVWGENVFVLDVRMMFRKLERIPSSAVSEISNRPRVSSRAHSQFYTLSFHAKYFFFYCWPNICIMSATHYLTNQDISLDKTFE